MVPKQAFLAVIPILGRTCADADPFDITADHLAWDDTTYTLISSRPNPEADQAWLPQSNGYIGLTQGSLGPFLEVNSLQQTFATVNGFWDHEPDGKRVIAGIPHFTDLLVGACNSTLNGTTATSEISDFKSTFSFSTGIATWDYVWSPSTCSEDIALKVSYEAFLSLDERHIAAVKLAVSSNSEVEILVTDVLDGHSASRTSDAEPRFFPPKKAILTSVKPAGVEDVSAFVFSTMRGDDLPKFQKGLSADPNTKTISQSYSVTLDPDLNDGASTFVKYVGVMSTEHFPDAKALVPKAVTEAAEAGWDALRSAHTAYVAALMDSDLLADFRDTANGVLPEDKDIRWLQITAIASTYYLYTSLLPYEEPDATLSDSLWNMLESGCASWTLLLQSFYPYIGAPWYHFSEHKNDNRDIEVGPNPGFPFMTGHEELLRFMTAGFLGVRTTDANLVLNPSLPPQVAHFKAPVQFYNGAVVECRMNRTHTTITRRDGAEFNGLAEDGYGNGAMPITIGRSTDDSDGYTIHLKVGETVVIANRQHSDKLTTHGNILQCKASSSPDAHVLGQLPIAATDGYTGTSWQPESDSAATLVVSLGASADEHAVELDSILLDFGMRPPKNIRILISNQTSFAEPAGVEQQQSLGQWVPVVITKPWIPDSQAVRDSGNTTVVELPRGVWSGRYARLDIDGCWTEDRAGATVAEFALISRGSAVSEGEHDAPKTVDFEEVGHDEL
ncbi:hypothetical protein KVR01_007335 [Diaporthe batatas]|uniref:uncharacterized protein n=1 Tax=Diaporthe batatas TaxID=748121 RepID=UPI001D057B17|nr:uncharacterized protein KVR01_007335 [Diaporthe batatas]KAG8162857.1 hypothetical protein KVR01_007335 [Diaporthe batatas]